MSMTNPDTFLDTMAFLALYAGWLLAIYVVFRMGWV